jgi:hypothetical protein
MKEREKTLSGKKKRALAARTVYVSLDRADAFIEGGPPFAMGRIWVPDPLIFGRVRV